MKQVTEVVEFGLKEGCSDEQMFDIVDNMTEYLNTETGYIDAELIKGESKWYVIIHWDNMENANASSAKFMETPETEEYRKNIVNPSVWFTEKAQYWKK